MDIKEWEKRNEDHVSDIARDADLSDEAFVDVLEDLNDRAQSSVDAKRAEMED